MFKITCCTTVDMPLEFFEQRGIYTFMLKFLLNGQLYNDDCGQTVSHKAFYEAIAKGAMPTTSQLNPIDYYTGFEKLLQEGYDILHFSLSSGISGTYQSAMEAKKQLETKYPERKIVVIDSLSASSGSGLLLTIASDMQQNGESMEAIATWAEANKTNVNHLFFSTDLSHLKRGGRISPAAAAIAGILNICPLLMVDIEGHLVPCEKIRGIKKCIKTTVQKMLQSAENGKDYNGYCYISHSNSLDIATELKQQILENFPNIKEIPLFPIGMVIGSHTGPGTVALYFMGKQREK